MSLNEDVNLTELLSNERFPLSAKYDPWWVVRNHMAPHPLWLTEWLCRDMQLEPGMRVLDMGCGKAITSIFLAKEFGVQVWANDLWIKPTENWQRIREAGVEDCVFPIHAEARSLPYAEGFFDAIVSVDAHNYYGTDDLYLDYFVKFVRLGGRIGIAVPGLMCDFDGPVPEHLTRRQKSGGVFWGSVCWAWHTPYWWRHLWGRTGLVDMVLAEPMPDGWRVWLQFEKATDAAGTNQFPSDQEALEADGGRYIGFVRMVARRKEEQYTMQKQEEMNEILERAEARQTRAEEILEELDLVNRWSPYGRPIVVGSVSHRLVVEPDIDMEVYTEEPRVADGFRVAAALAENNHVIGVIFRNELLKPGGAWIYWEIDYRDDDGVVWTIELYHSKPNAPYAGWMEQFAGAMRKALTDEHRVAILTIKEVLCANRTMRDTKSFYIYRAVIGDGVRTFDEYTAWMEANKPDGMMEWTLDADEVSGHGSDR